METNISFLMPVTILAKLAPSSWTDKSGNSRISYPVNYQQDSGNIVGRITVPEAVYNQLDVGGEYFLEGTFVSGTGKTYPRITNLRKMPSGKGGAV